MRDESTTTRPLNAYSEITIKGTRYKIHSVFDGKKSFQSLLEDLIVEKASQQQTHPEKDENYHAHDCEENEFAI